eukprot:CAMPEP_0118892994 /NCGR_PEP_ID=MMETSP1166-20130328/2380_1 /TAXON_ID=1104430 /ORGANISM="Chrysoreinhardia sp, Strain CCMP3193" /LENGTH=112 /DNA_ID=CAMNT_0006831765 /DNA_START=30 /DNA_END=364 /DNA_ORIENTATION=-
MRHALKEEGVTAGLFLTQFVDDFLPGRCRDMFIRHCKAEVRWKYSSRHDGDVVFLVGRDDGEDLDVGEVGRIVMNGDDGEVELGLVLGLYGSGLTDRDGFLEGPRGRLGLVP